MTPLASFYGAGVRAAWSKFALAERPPDVAKAAVWKERIPGGLSVGKSPSDFPKSLIAQGKRVESEHTSSGPIATEIAMDHLTEDRKYYDKLKQVEKDGTAR